MVKNNIKSFFMHLIISFVFVRIFIIFNQNHVKWASEAAARSHYFLMTFNVIIRIALAGGLYYLLARNYLKNQGNIYRNMLSTSLTAIIGICLWVIAYNNGLPAQGKYLLDLGPWQKLANYLGYSLLFFTESHANNPYVYLPFLFIPTAVMALSIEKEKANKGNCEETLY
ncbi:hypothetical protein [Desnuesiella massiliensis]|uniref:hypothetical protein n=1 Tax=Desnuesiella massiliensis TaxID=1650662 RepID=UPI0006E3C19F|nr:hypothetical protein [Desnuesiella massiliensis]